MPAFSKSCAAAALTGLLFSSQIALAHVAFVAERELVVDPGETVTLEWYDLVPHETVAWHVDLLFDDPGESQTVVHDLPSDVYSYDWVVPDVTCGACRLRVIQDNVAVDYEGFLPVRIGAEELGAGGDTADRPDSSSAGGGFAVTTSSAGGASSTGVTSTAGASVSGSTVSTSGVGGASTSAGAPSASRASSSCAMGPSGNGFSGSGLLVFALLVLLRCRHVGAGSA